MKFTWQLVNHQGSTQASLSGLLEGPYRVKVGFMAQIFVAFDYVLGTEMYSVCPQSNACVKSKANVTVHAHTPVFSDSGRMQAW